MIKTTRIKRILASVGQGLTRANKIIEWLIPLSSNYVIYIPLGIGSVKIAQGGT